MNGQPNSVNVFFATHLVDDTMIIYNLENTQIHLERFSKEILFKM